MKSFNENLLLFELDLREFGIKYNTFITHAEVHIMIVPWRLLVNDTDLCHSSKLPKNP